jgi:DNA-binding GntR family transcriptional regulator
MNSELNGKVNARSPEVIASKLDEVRDQVRAMIYSFSQMQRSAKEHRDLFEALRTGQADLAALAFELHVQTGKQRMLDTVSMSPFER